MESARTLSAADTFDGYYRLAELARAAAAQWEHMDVLLVPTAPRPYTLAEVAADPMLPNSRLGTYTNFVNLLDLTGVAVPAGLRAEGVPWGVTFLAPAWRDAEFLALGAGWHTELGGKLGATDTELDRAGSTPTPIVSLPRPTRLAVVGAHLAGLPLNHQLTSVGSRLVWSGTTAPHYKLFALPNTQPPKPGLVRVDADGAQIAVEVWEMPIHAFGAFVAAVPPPLCIGTLELANGDWVKGFLCEGHGLAGAREITTFGGWRAFLAEPKNAARGGAACP